MTTKPYRVYYDLAYDCGGSGPWQKDYRTRVGAEVSRFWNRHIASWGGKAELSRRVDRVAARAVVEDAAFQNDPEGYMRTLSTQPGPMDVTTMAELDSLPNGTVIRDSTNAVWVREHHNCWMTTGVTIGRRSHQMGMYPMRILYRPGEIS